MAKVAKNDGKKVTHYLLILDKSGSMFSIRDVTISGFNENVQMIKQLQEKYPDQDFTVSLIIFNNDVDTVMWRADPKELQELEPQEYVPCGMTALYDAMGTGLSRLQGELYTDAKENPEIKFVVTVFTDGAENRSSEYDGNTISKMNKDLQETEQWTFTYIGANHDVAETAAKLSIPASNTITYSANPESTKAAFAAHKQGLDHYASVRSHGGSVATNMYSQDEIGLDLTGIDEDNDGENEK